MDYLQSDTKKTNGMEKDQETAHIQKIALAAFLLNLGLAAMKAALAFYSGSLAVTAGAIDSATDAIASILLLGGLKLSAHKSHSFPLGLYKIENFISVFVALSIFFAGYEIAGKVLAGDAVLPKISVSVVILLFGAVAATYFFGCYALMAGQRTGSPALIAEGRHRQVDVLSSIVVLVSVLPEYFGWYLTVYGISIDQIAACVVLIFIARAGWVLLSDGMRVLLDASVDFETLARAKEILESHPMVVKVSSLMGRSAGRFRFLQTNVVLRTSDLEKAHQISEALELDIQKRIPHVEKILIHYEPRPRPHFRIAVPLADPEGSVSDHFGDSPWFAFVTVRLDACTEESQEVLENPHREVDVAKGIRVAEWLVQKNVDYVVMREDLSRKGPGYVMANAGIKVLITSADNLRKAIEGVVCTQEVRH